MRKFSWIGFAGFAWMLTPLLAEEGSVSRAEKVIPRAVSEKIRAELSAEALVVMWEKKPLLQIWIRRELPSRADAQQIANGLTYREIEEGTLLGVVEFLDDFVDFRKQKIPKGIYTLRLAVQPDIGDHKDTAPHQDFALVVPAAADTTPDALEIKDVVGLSRKAPGGDHPGVVLLFPYYGKEAKPQLVTKPGGISVVHFKQVVATEPKKTELGFGITVRGFSDKR